MNNILLIENEEWRMENFFLGYKYIFLEKLKFVRWDPPKGRTLGNPP